MVNDREIHNRRKQWYPRYILCILLLYMIASKCNCSQYASESSVVSGDTFSLHIKGEVGPTLTIFVESLIPQVVTKPDGTIVWSVGEVSIKTNLKTLPFRMYLVRADGKRLPLKSSQIIAEAPEGSMGIVIEAL